MSMFRRIGFAGPACGESSGCTGSHKRLWCSYTLGVGTYHCGRCCRSKGKELRKNRCKGREVTERVAAIAVGVALEP